MRLRVTLGAFRSSGGAAAGARRSFAGVARSSRARKRSSRVRLGVAVEMLPAPVARSRDAHQPEARLAEAPALLRQGCWASRSSSPRCRSASICTPRPARVRGAASPGSEGEGTAGPRRARARSSSSTSSSRAWAQLYAANKDLATYEAALSTVTHDVFGEDDLRPGAARARNFLAQQTGSADDDPMPHVDAFDVMVKLSQDISPSTTHDVEELDIQKQHATVHTASSPTIPEEQAIKRRRSTPRSCFSDVNISRFNARWSGLTGRSLRPRSRHGECPEDQTGRRRRATTTRLRRERRSEP